MARQPGTYATFNTSEGNIVCRLFEKEAPITTKNFIDLAEGKRQWKDSVSGKGGSGPLYSGTIFHRGIPDFMIHGGDPSGTGMGGRRTTRPCWWPCCCMPIRGMCVPRG